jgi:hypothetical protein
VVAQINDHRSLMRAIGAGIIPIAASAAGCSTTETPR